MKKQTANIDGNEATAYVAHKTNEVIAIYPITPSSTMRERGFDVPVPARLRSFRGSHHR